MFIFVALLVLFSVSFSKELYVDYSRNNDSLLLYRYTHGLHGKMFADLGAYDPIERSNVAMFTDWDGVHV